MSSFLLNWEGCYCLPTYSHKFLPQSFPNCLCRFHSCWLSSLPQLLSSIHWLNFRPKSANRQNEPTFLLLLHRCKVLLLLILHPDTAASSNFLLQLSFTSIHTIFRSRGGFVWRRLMFPKLIVEIQRFAKFQISRIASKFILLREFVWLKAFSRNLKNQFPSFLKNIGQWSCSRFQRPHAQITWHRFWPPRNLDGISNQLELTT